jgi:hypothetical protein
MEGIREAEVCSGRYKEAQMYSGRFLVDAHLFLVVNFACMIISEWLLALDDPF